MSSTADARRALRGHDFFPPAGELAAIPGYRKTERIPAAEKVIRLHYFIATADWWIAEAWQEEGQWITYGYTQYHSNLHGAEWGCTSLTELEETVARLGPFPAVVERDLYWTPVPFWQTAAVASLATWINGLATPEAAAAALEDLPGRAAADRLTPDSITTARQMILARFPATPPLNEDRHLTREY